MGAIVAAVLVALAGTFVYYEYARPAGSSTSSVPPVAGGFTEGHPVTLLFNGTNTYSCTPTIPTLFPHNATATTASRKTPCEVGAADQEALPEFPQWLLVPAFGNVTVFGEPSLGSSADGFAERNGSLVLTDCGAGGSVAQCPDQPKYLYSPLITQVEIREGLSTGVGGLPLGVLPTPAHDFLLDTSTSFYNVYWGTILVFVLDPNIFPDRTNGTCTKAVPSNLTNATGNCLTSLTALNAAFATCSSASAEFNAATSNALWSTLVADGSRNCSQVVVPEDTTVGAADVTLNGNLYIPYALTPGAPPSFPT